MAFLACPSCKYIWCCWDEKANGLYHNQMIIQLHTHGMPCPMCYAEMKINMGEPPETCHHGISLQSRCRECHKNDPEIRNHIEEIKRLSQGK